MKRIFLLLLVAACSQVLQAQDGKVNQRAQPVLEQKHALENKDQACALYEKKWLISGNDTLPYRLLYPENYDPKKKYPLIVFLHGSGERGRDNEKQLLHGGDLFLRADVRKNYPAIVLFPQCPESD